MNFNLSPFIIAPLISIYSFSVTTINKGVIPLSNYEGKKMIFVNIATQSEYAPQLSELEAFYESNKDSIEVIAFPSNSFSHEPNTNEQLYSFFSDSLNLTFPIVQLSEVTGDSAHPVYMWLNSIEDNGVMSEAVNDDFKKFLISADGQIVGIFSKLLNPLDPLFLYPVKRDY